MKRLGITGAGGFIGAALAARASARGVEVVGVDRDAAALQRVLPLMTRAVADVRDTEAMARALAGCDTVVHTAAKVEEGGTLDSFRDVNVRGSLATAIAAKRAGARRFVHLSSVMVYGFRFPPFVVEDGPFRGDGNPYCITKIESEVAVRGEADDAFSVIVVRPGDVYGARSVPWVTRPLEMMRARTFALPEHGTGILNHVHVEHLVDAITMLIDADVRQGAFNVTDERATTTAEFFGYHARMLGRTGIPRVSTAAMRTAITALATVAALRGRPAMAAPEAVDFLARPHAYGTERIRRLGYRPRIGLEEGMRGVAAELGLADPVLR